ncbi:hypothetical protein LRHMDP2_668 [Lacticaseibacillus rhamnosus LRHMDP2]|uniref:Uncharacterized protein n=1 Tax=Lacticaseibacillus rhamnosus LRHMDP3 TaxID=1203259 RepID=A0AB33XU13_LACRH|nr:hypothetical protein LRHMDP3_1550 [Lacticaseibacillus rhamnosus LRHMDP3]EKS53417.1 hypothetical protein LRHMDP2_668 [Lacticaseibacillus rhamnosus LRHMDP2]
MVINQLKKYRNLIGVSCDRVAVFLELFLTMGECQSKREE